MAAGLTLDPERFAAPGIIGHPACLYGQAVGFFIHVGDHEDLVCSLLLDDYRKEAVGALFEILPGKSRLRFLFHADPGIFAEDTGAADSVFSLRHQDVDPFT